METIKRKCKVVMLPSNEKLEIGKNMICSNYNHDYLSCGLIKAVEGYEKISIPQHLYVISDDEIKENDYYISGGRLYIANTPGQSWLLNNFLKTINKDFEAKKVIATTDKLMLPLIPQSFIEEYCESNGKIDEINVGYTKDIARITFSNGESGLIIVENIILNSSNEVIINKNKDNYTREEVEDLIRRAFVKGYYTGSPRYAINNNIVDN